VTWCGKPFQTRAAATGKARSPMVDSRVRRTISNGDEADRIDDVERHSPRTGVCCCVSVFVSASIWRRMAGSEPVKSSSCRCARTRTFRLSTSTPRFLLLRSFFVLTSQRCLNIFIDQRKWNTVQSVQLSSVQFAKLNVVLSAKHFSSGPRHSN